MILSEGYKKIGDHKKAEFYKKKAIFLAKERGMISAVNRIKKIVRKTYAIH